MNWKGGWKIWKESFQKHFPCISLELSRTFDQCVWVASLPKTTTFASLACTMWKFACRVSITTQFPTKEVTWCTRCTICMFSWKQLMGRIWWRLLRTTIHFYVFSICSVSSIFCIVSCGRTSQKHFYFYTIIFTRGTLYDRIAQNVFDVFDVFDVFTYLRFLQKMLTVFDVFTYLIFFQFFWNAPYLTYLACLRIWYFPNKIECPVFGVFDVFTYLRFYQKIWCPQLFSTYSQLFLNFFLLFLNFFSTFSSIFFFDSFSFFNSYLH